MYAALSRVRSLDGLQVIGFRSSLVRAEQRAVQYYTALQAPSHVPSQSIVASTATVAATLPTPASATTKPVRAAAGAAPPTRHQATTIPVRAASVGLAAASTVTVSTSSAMTSATRSGAAAPTVVSSSALLLMRGGGGGGSDGGRDGSGDSAASARPAMTPVQPSQTALRCQPMRRAVKDAANRVVYASVVAALPYDMTVCPIATIGNGVEVKLSNLPNAGRGLFATRDFAFGDLVTEYDGEVIDAAEANARKAANASTHIRSAGPQHAFIDGLHVPDEAWRGGASFANDPVGQPDLLNTVLYQYRPTTAVVGVNRAGSHVLERVYLKAKKVITAGQEIYVDYGRDFWDLYPKSK
jgi:hypothetical protein